MLCVEDYLDALNWAKSLGGVKALIARADANAKALADWVERTPWIDFLARVPETRSNTSVCLKVVDPAVAALPADGQAAFAKALAGLLEKEKVAFDIGAYRDAPPGLRIWCGATVETDDVEALTRWLDYAFALEKAQARQGGLTVPRDPPSPSGEGGGRSPTDEGFSQRRPFGRSALALQDCAPHRITGRFGRPPSPRGHRPICRFASDVSEGLLSSHRS